MVHIQRLQDAVRRLQDDVGEPWAPEPTASFLERRATEMDLVDVVVAAVSLASRYGVALQPAFSAASINVDLSALTVWRGEARPAQLAEAVAPVAECVAFYQDETKVSGNRDIVSLWEAVPRLLLAAFTGFASVWEFRQRLSEYFESASGEHPTHDPSRSEPVRLIAPIQQATFCPFAAKSALWGAPAYDRSLSLEDNLQAALPTLREFLRVMNLVGRDKVLVAETPQDRDVLDGYVFALPVDVFGASFEDLKQTFRRFMDYLLRVFTGKGVDAATVTDPKWYMVLDHEEVFVSVFSPCYPNTHSRYSHGVTDWILIMLQPEAAILRLLNRHNYATRSANIRQRFREGFQTYELADVEIDRFLLPLRAGDPVVRWYDDPAEEAAA